MVVGATVLVGAVLQPTANGATANSATANSATAHKWPIGFTNVRLLTGNLADDAESN